MITTFFTKISLGIASIGMFVGGLLGITPEQATLAPIELGADTVLPIAGATYYLSGTGISSSATSFTLTSFTIPQNGKKIQDSEMSDTFYLTFEPGSRTRQEIASCTTVTQNGDGTATISGCTRGLSPVSPYTASTSLQFAHSGGSSVVFSNPPQLYNQVAFKDNDETITGQWTFEVFPVTASTSIASATTSGIAELATGAEAASSTIEGDIAGSKLALHTGISTSSAPSSGNVVVVTQDDGNIDPGFISVLATTTLQGMTYGGFYATATASTTFTGETAPQASFITASGTASTTSTTATSTRGFSGFAVTSATEGGTVKIQTGGIVSGFSGLEKGRKYYTSTSGNISASFSDASVPVGTAVSSSEILIDRSQKRAYLYTSPTLTDSGNAGATVLTATINPGFIPRMMTAFVPGDPASASNPAGYQTWVMGTILVGGNGQYSLSSVTTPDVNGFTITVVQNTTSPVNSNIYIVIEE